MRQRRLRERQRMGWGRWLGLGGMAVALGWGAVRPGVAHELPTALPAIYEAASPSESQRHQLIDNLEQAQHQIEAALSPRQRQALALALADGATLEAAVATVSLTPLQQADLAEIMTAYRQQQVAVFDPQQQYQLIRAGQPWQQF